MAKKAKPAEAGTAEVRPNTRAKHSDYASVTNGMLAVPSHGIPCDRVDCDRDAVYVMADHEPSRGMYGTSSARVMIVGGKRYVRCAMHLNRSAE